MTQVEQHKMILALRDYEPRMSADEQSRFAMYLKRDRDDEELDELARTRLEAMHAKYCGGHSKQSMEEKWKSMQKGGRRDG
jgi:hypothetical protein